MYGQPVSTWRQPIHHPLYHTTFSVHLNRCLWWPHLVYLSQPDHPLGPFCVVVTIQANHGHRCTKASSSNQYCWRENLWFAHLFVLSPLPFLSFPLFSSPSSSLFSSFSLYSSSSLFSSSFFSSSSFFIFLLSFFFFPAEKHSWIFGAGNFVPRTHNFQACLHTCSSASLLYNFFHSFCRQGRGDHHLLLFQIYTVILHPCTLQSPVLVALNPKL